MTRAVETTDEGAGARLLTDLGPLMLFLVAYWLGGVFVATGVFMAAILAAVIMSKLRFGRVSPMLGFSALMVVVLGGLTLFLHDERFIKVKPTIYYATVAVLLGFGWLTKRPILRSVLGNVYPELDVGGWHKLGRNFALFFVAMALLNEAVWRNTTTGFWLGWKLWGALPLTLLFGLANVPMILKHSRKTDAEAPVPPSA